MLILLSATAASGTTTLPQRTNRWVYDEAAVITAEREQAMEQVHAELYQKTGVAIVIVTVASLLDETIDALAVRIGQAWGVGKKGQDRGLVVAFARDQRKIFVATGYGVEGYLPDGRVGRLMEKYAMPDLRRDDFSSGLFQLSQALVAISAEEFGVEIVGLPKVDPDESGEQRPSLFVILLSIVGFIYLAIKHPRLLLLLLMFGGNRRHGGGGGFGGGGFGGGGFGGGGAGRGF